MSDSGYNDLHKHGMTLKFAYSIVGLVLGLCCIIAGSILCLYGVTGHTTMAASLLGLKTQLNDAAPGVVVFVVGIFMVFITRFRVSDRVTYPATNPGSGGGGGGGGRRHIDYQIK